MKKTLIYLASAVVAFLGFSACSTEPEALDLQPAYKYSDEYYKALRAYKKSDHSIAYIFFGDYGTPYSPAFRFAGIPDSVDVVNLWGGIPKNASDKKEMYEMRDKKGTKIVACKIVRLAPSNSSYYSYSWAKEAEIPSFMTAYKTAYDRSYATNYASNYATFIANGASEEQAASDAHDAANAAAETSGYSSGIAALRSDISANPRRTRISGSEADGTAVYEYPEWCVFAADYLLMEVWTNDLDGYDLDWEPEGDALDRDAFYTFVQYLAQYIGPKSEDPETLLIVDRNADYSSYNNTVLPQLCNYWIHQKYGGTGGASRTTDSDYPLRDDPSLGWTNSQIIVTENIGDTWDTGGVLEQYGSFQPSRGGRKGGFAAFHGQRDYNTTESGANKATPYGHLRKAIQLQNPAVTR